MAPYSRITTHLIIKGALPVTQYRFGDTAELVIVSAVISNSDQIPIIQNDALAAVGCTWALIAAHRHQRIA